MIENNERNNLNDYLNQWIIKKIETELNSLIELKNIKRKTLNLELWLTDFTKITVL